MGDHQNARVRFAPSPTGPLHIGGLRTALFNFLFARRNGGKFILRIEDTDQARFVPGAEEYINESLGWCGLEVDEGVRQGGPFGPYRQSERKDIYMRYALELVEKGHAYFAFDSPEDLENLRKGFESRGETFTYDAQTRRGLKNSLNMDRQEVEELLASDIPRTIRFRFDPDKMIIMHDLVRGEVVVNSSTLDDKILFKADGMPTYHLANVVDDNLMAISHVIRGEEWLPSLPLHVSLFRAFGWEHLMPKYAHLPLILKPGGKGKLSKRDGDKGGFPVFPLEWKDPETGEISKGYREEGYLPEACVNLLALLGWNPGTDRELFTMGELISEFSLEKVGKSGARFDPEKARWFNLQHIQLLPVERLAGEIGKVLGSRGIECDREKLVILAGLIRPRLTFLHETWEQSWFFFQRPETYDPGVVQKGWKEDMPEKMGILADAIAACEPFDPAAVENCVKSLITEKKWGLGPIMNAWRLLLVGAPTGPGLFELASFLGREEVIDRMQDGIGRLGKIS
ncbi:MAG: glutamate--tRNA ligase [Bacteroidetes bacterium]|nr:MAG: glutamate--tRNA ligase [Bacteroidota bacterium]